MNTARSLSLMVSLPAMVAAFTRYSRDDRFVVLDNRRFAILTVSGSVARTVVGGLLVGVMPEGLLIPLLGALLLISAVSVWRHDTPTSRYANRHTAHTDRRRQNDTEPLPTRRARSALPRHESVHQSHDVVRHAASIALAAEDHNHV